MNKGKVIVVEGCCNGALKSMQHRLLGERLQKDGEKVVMHHFPSYGTEQGNFIKMYLACKYGELDELSPYFVNSLYAYDRAITWHGDLKDEYNNGSTILLDRYTTSSLMYQSRVIEDINERKDFINYVIDFEYNKLGIQEPDMILFLYTPFELRLEYETCNDMKVHKGDLDEMKRVYDNSLFVADYLGWEMVKCNKDDELLSSELIHNDVYSRVRKRFK